MPNCRSLTIRFLPPIKLAVVAIGMTLGSAGQTVYSEDALPIDDGWRRTAAGWERLDDWRIAHSAPREQFKVAQATSGLSQETRHLDIHPAGLALLQVLLIAASYSLWTPKAIRRSPINGVYSDAIDIGRDLQAA